MLAAATGIGFRRELSARLLLAPSRVDFVEVVAEACRDPTLRREAQALAAIWPVVPHGVKLSLGGADPIDDERAALLGKLARELRAPCVSEHVSFVRAGGHEIGHLTDLPRTREAVRALARNVERLRRRLPDVPLLLENVAMTFALEETDHEMTEPDFYAEVVEATGCELLLDVANLYANALNAGFDPLVHLAAFPLERTAMMHVAGGIVEDGFYFDTHADPVPGPVFDLVGAVRAVRPDAAVLLERDGGFDDAESVLAEVDRLRAISPTAVPRRADRRALRAVARSLAAVQVAFAACLTGSDDDAFTSVAIARARKVLERKRADDALPLLARLRTELAAEEALALGGLASTPRLGTMTAVRDAWSIAQGAFASHPDAAMEDALMLRARFTRPASRPAPRVGPFVGRARLGSGRVVWVTKGIGVESPVRVFSFEGSRSSPNDGLLRYAPKSVGEAHDGEAR